MPLGRIGVLLLFVLLACKPGEGESAGETGGSTGGGSTGDSTGAPTTGAPTTGASMFDGVRLATLATYRPLDGGEVEASVDPLADGTSMRIEAGGQSYPGVYDGAAWVEFAGVPEGPYTLRRDAPAGPWFPGVSDLVATAARDLYVGEVRSGRPDVAFFTSDATRLAISATNMTELWEGDSFRLYSYNADASDGLSLHHYPGGTPPPPKGATAIDNWVAPWNPNSTRGGGPLIDPGKGDDLWLTHIRSTLVDDQPKTHVDSLVEAARLTGPAMLDGQVTAVSGAFEPTPQTTIPVDLRADEFFAALATNIASPKKTSCSVHLVLDPGEDLPVQGVTPTLAQISIFGYDAPIDPGCVEDCATQHVPPGDVALDLPYGNPFTGGTETMSVHCTSRAWGGIDPAEAYDDVVASVSLTGTVAALSASALAPTLGPVQDIRIDGTPLPPDEQRMGLGMTPTISFSPPTLGAADYYTVQVRTFRAQHLAPQGRQIASFSTTGTSVTLPDGLLESGEYYCIEVQARQGRELTAGRPYQFAQAISQATTGVFKP